ncbi:DUF3080 family protein [Alteromonas macleodii]|uniref:DUF3080 domain-containing protein n=1 Tax=Alteromonas macleodii TaxID=28108 RepID=A0AB36FT95_ALTMA|nr:DUF3080 family protein [Alteromonas macleodii]OES33239.1 hypothetical protein BFV95_1591 [Alteromonas macleodii]OES35371.1 hypothetical protein BFV94_1592 [Alteromonas macleodii]OES36292.1 hypothetical protein BFV93_1588 [Alteromonas macleodii]OES42405.1 hypothetical protein BFV96_1591 [Alteromonas macleodii]OZC00428.1 hypothetical protein BBP29_12230 [Alteromonas macleodii]
MNISLVKPWHPKVSQLRNACRAGVISVAMFALLGCFGGSTVKQSIDDYAARLSRVLDTPLPDSFNDKITTPLPKLADSATLKHAIEGVNINLREFYALQDCELGTVVAERNTSLGKSQLPSQRLVYESKLLNVLRSCEAALTKENESNQRNAALAATISSWREQKTQDYSKTWANLVQGSQELRLALNTPERLFSVENNRDALSSVNALYYINSLSNKELLLSDMYSSNTASSDTETEATNENNSESIIESSELEQQLKIIRSARLPATLWHTQQTLTQNLSLLTDMLETELDAVSCPEGRASDKAKILRNVFYLFFIEEIQPVGSLVNQYHYKLAPLWEDWLAQPSLHEEFKRYIRQQSQDGFNQYSSAMKAHVNLWQGFLGRCNLSPVAPV